MVDSNPDDANYHARVHNFKAAVVTKFENYYSPEDNPIVSLFQTMIRFEQSVLDLDFMGLEKLANELEALRKKVDANLRAVISRMLETDIMSDVPYEEEFVSRVFNLQESATVKWIENYRNRHKNSSK